MLIPLLFSRVALAFPAEDAWIALTHDGAVMTDVSDDHEHDSGAFDATDLAGTDEFPVAEWYADDDALYLRMRLNDDPSLGAAILSCSWAFRFDTDDDPSDWEWQMTLLGPLGLPAGYTNSDAGIGDPANAYDPGFVFESWSDTAADSAINSLPDAWLAMRIERSTLGADFATTFRVYAVTETSGSPTDLDTDYANWDDTLGDPDTSVWSDPIGIDQDADGLTDIVEDATGTDKADADTDDDGLDDGDELALGTSGTSWDSDGDGLSDGQEVGVDTAGPGTDTAVFVPDADPDTTTDPLVADTDGGGLLDGAEDHDHNGRVDAWETDPNDASDDVDIDGDGIGDVLEEICGGEGDDRDGDGIPDVDEGLADSDGDGQPDFCDGDDDNDGLSTYEETTDDSDGDGLVDYLDPDSDNNGILDGIDGTGDEDCDDIPAYRDLDEGDGDCADSDGDGVSNGDERACGSDPDDVDTDGDGIADGDESCDMDCDQLPDRLDPDDDEGQCDSAEDTAVEEDCTVDYACGNFTGGACSSVPAGAMVLPALAGLVLSLRRRKVAAGATPLPALRATLPPRGEGWSGAAAPPPRGEGGSGAAATPPRGEGWSGAAAPLLLATTLLLPRPAHAAELDAERFTPSLDSTVGFAVDDTEIGNGVSAGLVLDYALNPLVYRYDDPGREESVALANLATANLSVGYGWRFLRLGVQLPAHVVDGDLSGTGPAIGDLRAEAKVRLVPRRGWNPGVALLADVAFPTGSDGTYVGAKSARFGGYALLSSGDRFTLAGKIGIRGGATEQIDADTLWGTELAWGVAASYPVYKDDLRLVAEVEGDASLSAMNTRGAVPAEWRAGVDWRAWKSLHVVAAGGTGLTEGIGAPDVRGVLGLRWAPTPRTGMDRDHDGIVDAEDLCPDEKEDRNGVVDDDGCPDAGRTRTRFAVVDGGGKNIANGTIALTSGPDQGTWTLPDGEMTRWVLPGAYGVRASAEGYTPAERTCEVRLRDLEDCAVTVSRVDDRGRLHITVRDNGGKPVDAQIQVGEEIETTLGSDGDETVNVSSGERTVWIYGDAFRATRRKVTVTRDHTTELSVVLEPTKTKIEGDRIEIYEMVLFDTDKASIRPESYGILDDVVGKMQRHPEIRRILIEGYTDSKGTELHNLELSRARAESVRAYLLEAGVNAARLDARGFGETAARTAHGGEDEVEDPAQRRVIFRIIQEGGRR